MLVLGWNLCETERPILSAFPRDSRGNKASLCNEGVAWTEKEQISQVSFRNLIS